MFLHCYFFLTRPISVVVSFVYFLLLILSLVVSASALDCPERLTHLLTYLVGSM